MFQSALTSDRYWPDVFFRDATSDTLLFLAAVKLWATSPFSVR
jgi:hypothetical protein